MSVRKGVYYIVFDLFSDEFKKTLESQAHAEKYPFDFDSEFVTSHFGPEKKHGVNYHEFTQLIKVI